MNVNWDWANRSIRAIQSLAAQWQVDIWAASSLWNEISEESRRQFQMYEKSCLESGLKFDREADMPSIDIQSFEPFDELFSAWTHDQVFMDGLFDVFDGTDRG